MSNKKDGILKQLSDNSNINYKPFSINKLLEALEFLYSNRISNTREYVMYTGLKGYETYNFAFLFGSSFVCNWWFNNFNKSEGIKKFTFYLNVIRKHSLYKVLVEKLEKDKPPIEYRFTLMKGTQTVSWHYNIKSLNKELTKLVEEADLEDLKREEERLIRLQKIKDENRRS